MDATQLLAFVVGYTSAGRLTAATKERDRLAMMVGLHKAAAAAGELDALARIMVAGERLLASMEGR